jgi:hypothetical protein
MRQEADRPCIYPPTGRELRVNAVRDAGANITTSLTRSDTGPGACEVMLVEEVDTF